MRVALVHDWLTGTRGGERVLEALCELYPEADLYTLLHVPGSVSPRIEARRIVTSPLQRLPGVGRHYRKLVALLPWAIRRLRVEGYDLVLSTHHAVAKAVPHPPATPHLCICFTPMRYVWDQIDAYLGGGWRRRAATPLVAYLRRFDVRTSGEEQVTRFVAISETVADRIRRRYGRPARVVHPPVDVERIRPNGRPPQDFYLLVGGFVPYKRDELALEAFRELPRRLVVAGDGPGRRALQRGAPPNVEFRGRVSDAELADLYARCRAVVYPPEEDFGLVPLEAQAAARPVIAFGRGGATETVRPFGSGIADATGLFFARQAPSTLAAAVRHFESVEDRFDPKAIRAHAERFSGSRFRREIQAEVLGLLERGAARPSRVVDGQDPRQ